MDGVPQLGGVQFGNSDADEPICGEVAGREPGAEEPGAAPVMPSGEATPGVLGALIDGFRRTGLPPAGALRAGAEFPSPPPVVEVWASTGPMEAGMSAMVTSERASQRRGA